MKRFTLVSALVLAAAVTTVASAEDDVTSLSYISYLERYATVQPATQEESLEAVMNMPIVPGDRIDTAREARMEVQLADGAMLWLDEYTSVSFDAIAFSRDSQSDRTVLYLAEGDLFVDVPETDLAAEPLRVDSPSSTVHLHRPGFFRVTTQRDGTLRVETWEGLAEASTPSGGVLVRAGSSSELSGGQVVHTEAQVSGQDDFALWVTQRRGQYGADSVDHLSSRYARQAASLDSYGNWIYVDTYNTWAWQPTVAAGWRPYTAGRWYWTSVGWNWLSYEPWGWLPYHYGSWYFDAGLGWLWLWDPYWGPAWVDWVWWPGYVGWCPRGYYDYWWWHNCWDCWGGGGGGHHHGGAGDTRPRRSVLPPTARNGDTSERPRNPHLPAPRFTLDLRGEARMNEVSAEGWNVVRSNDFTSPHLPQLLSDAERTFANAPERGVVVSGPLVTPAPTTVESPTRLLEDTFRGVERSGAPDLTPILARSETVGGDRVASLTRATTPNELVDRAPRPVVTTPPTAVTRQTGGGAAVAAPVAAESRHDSPNLYRPTLRGGDALRGSPSTSVVRPEVGGRSPSTSTPTLRNDRSTPGRGTLSWGNPSSEPSTPVLRRSPVTPRTPQSAPLTGSRSSGEVPRLVAPSTGSSRPTIVPRTSPVQPNRGYTPAPSGSYRIIPPSSSSRSSVSPYSGRPSVFVPRSSTGHSYSRPSTPSVRSYSAPRSSSSVRSSGHSTSSSSRSSSASSSRPNRH